MLVRDSIEKNKDIKFMNVAKAIGIIAVVIGHSDAPIARFINLFHMPLFFFISGYFYNDKYPDNPIKFIRKRIKSLYIPYITYSVAILMLHNFFYKLNIYNDLVLYKGGESYSIYSFKDFVSNIINIFIFGQKEMALGAFWFIVSLFTVQVIFCLLLFACKRFKNRQIIISITVIIIFYIGYYTKLPRYLSTSLVALSIYYIGFLFKRYEGLISFKCIYAFISLGILVILSNYGEVNMSSNVYSGKIFFIISSCLGIYTVIFISQKLNGLKSLQYIGKNTMVIMALHLLAFKIVAYIQTVEMNLPIYMIGSHPVISGEHVWWIIYTIFGISIPLILKKILLYIKFIIYRDVCNGKFSDNLNNN